MSSGLTDAVNYHAWLVKLVLSEIYGTSCLEIGPGFGQYTPKWIDACKKVSITDIAYECTERMHTQFPQIEAYAVDVADTKWPSIVTKSGNFDTVIALNVLEHIENDEYVFKNIFEVLNSNGKFICIVPAHASLYGEMDRLAGHYRRYTKERLHAIALRSGFKVSRELYFNPIGGVAWYLNAKLLKPKTLSSSAINTQIRIFDKYFVPVSKLLSPIFKSCFGQSLFCSYYK